MPRPVKFDPFLKGFLLYLACLMLVQFAYKLLPLPAVGLISAVRETTFQHLKGAFYAYLLVSAIEAVVRRPRAAGFTMSRLLSAILFPWYVFLVWYIAPAISGGPMPSTLLEILYANVTLIVAIAACIVTERNLERIPYATGFGGVIVAFFLAMILLFTAFSYRAPWADVFTPPPGW